MASQISQTSPLLSLVTSQTPTTFNSLLMPTGTAQSSMNTEFASMLQGMVNAAPFSNSVSALSGQVDKAPQSAVTGLLGTTLPPEGQLLPDLAIDAAMSQRLLDMQSKDGLVGQAFQPVSIGEGLSEALSQSAKLAVPTEFTTIETNENQPALSLSDFDQDGLDQINVALSSEQGSQTEVESVAPLTIQVPVLDAAANEAKPDDTTTTLSLDAKQVAEPTVNTVIQAFNEKQPVVIEANQAKPRPDQAADDTSGKKPKTEHELMSADLVDLGTVDEAEGSEAPVVTSTNLSSIERVNSERTSSELERVVRVDTRPESTTESSSSIESAEQANSKVAAVVLDNQLGQVVGSAPVEVAMQGAQPVNPATLNQQSDALRATRRSVDLASASNNAIRSSDTVADSSAKVMDKATNIHQTSATVVNADSSVETADVKLARILESVTKQQKVSLTGGETGLASSVEAASDTSKSRGDINSLGVLHQPTLARPTSNVQLQMPAGMMPSHPQWGQAVSERVMWSANQKLQSASIQLDPPELGSLQVKLHITQDQVSVSFTSPHAHVRDALEQSLPRLREMMAEQGLNLGESSVEDQSSSQDQSRRERFAGDGRALIEESGQAQQETTQMSKLSLVDYYA